MDQEEGLIYRQLDDEEFEIRLKPAFDAFGEPMPMPGIRTAVAAMDGERVAGFLVLQFAPHVEPMYIEPSYKGIVNFQRLVNMMNEIITSNRGKGYFVFASNGRVAGMCQHNGMEEMRGIRVFRKKFEYPRKG